MRARQPRYRPPCATSIRSSRMPPKRVPSKPLAALTGSVVAVLAVRVLIAHSRWRRRADTVGLHSDEGHPSSEESSPIERSASGIADTAQLADVWQRYK